MLKRIVCVVLTVALVLCCFAGCGATKPKDVASDTATDAVTESTTEKPAADITGLDFSKEDTIKMSNYMNIGRATFSGSWIYGVSFVNHKGALHKIKEDNSEENVLNNDLPYFINVIGGWVFFLGYNWTSKTYSIKKVRLSGDDDATLVKAKENYNLYSMFIHDGKIYFTENNEAGDKNIGSFCRCDLDGKNRETLIDRAIYYPYVINDCILYQDDNDNERLHICSMDGSNDRVLIDHHVYKYIVHGSNLYYQSVDDRYYDDNGKAVDDAHLCLRRCNLDGTDDSVFMDLTNLADYFAIINDYLYYVDHDDENRLYSYSFSTKTIDLVSQDTLVRVINSLYPSDKVLYYDMGKKGDEYHVEHIYVCNPDGTGKYAITK